MLEDLFVEIAKGGDVEDLAAAADETITEQLNCPDPAVTTTPAGAASPARRRPGRAMPDACRHPATRRGARA